MQPDSAETLCAEFSATLSQRGSGLALANLGRQLEGLSASTWLACARHVAQLAHDPAAIAWLRQAVQHNPLIRELRQALASALWERGEVADAECELRALLATQPARLESLALLARLLRSDGRLGEASALMFDIWRLQPRSAAHTLQCADFIRHCQRHALAAQLCEQALLEGPRDAAVCAQAGMLALELGRFAAARDYLLEAIERGVDPNVYFATGALAFTQRYSDPAHADFARFRQHLRNPALSAKARATVNFALAKACDDVGDVATAAREWRAANADVRVITAWSAERYRQQIEALLRAPPPRVRVPAVPLVPVFVVGLPRSGTTLAAVSVGRRAGVRDRGELPHLAFIADRLGDGPHRQDAEALRDAARLYYAHLRQDDAPAQWYIDKTPTNFLRLDLVAALFPQAQIVHCRRNRRDTALSLYGQYFAHADGDFSYELADIAAFADGHDRLMAHWRAALPLPIHTLDYEDMVQQPHAAIARLCRAIGIAEGAGTADPPDTDGVIASSSLWQAKQPVYTSSIGRWRAYAAHLPELASLFPDATL